MKKLDSYLIKSNSTILDALNVLNNNAQGIVLVVDDERHLIATVTDGDIRRALMAATDISQPISAVYQAKTDKYKKPITTRLGTSFKEIKRIMIDNTIRQIPLMDDHGIVIDLITWEDVLSSVGNNLYALVMAGGFGKRLDPLTKNTPKPMLPVGGKPLLEIIINQLKAVEITNLFVSTHYLPEKIKDHFGDGSRFGVSIQYLDEEKPLGTGGALRLLPELDKSLVVVNGDVLTNMDLNAFVSYHRSHNSPMTVGVREYSYQIPYGVVENEGPYVTEIKEKPVVRRFINAGVYAVEPKAIDYIPRDQYFGMPDLVERLIQDKQTVTTYPILEYWLDIGLIDDYDRAQQDVKDKKIII